MVLAELGKKIHNALAKLNKATVIDEEMVKSNFIFQNFRRSKRHRNCPPPGRCEYKIRRQLT